MKKSIITMGIDFGVFNTLYLAFNNIDNEYRISAAPVSKSTGKMIKQASEPYAQIDNFNYRTARAVINIAIKHNVTIIQMEDLKGTEFTRNMFYFDLQRQICYIAAENNIITKFANRHFTSQMCSKCGYIDKNNRISQREFSCLNCGFSINADKNAAINISRANTVECKKGC